MPSLASLGGTPTFNGDSSCTINSGDNLCAPRSLLGTLMWVAARVKPSWAASLNPPGTNNPRVFSWRRGQYPDSIELFCTAGTDWSFEDQSSHGGGIVSVPATHGAGQSLTLVGLATPSQMKISLDGAAFTAAARGTILDDSLAASAFDIGSLWSDGSFAELMGDMFWIAIGRGTLTDADAAALHAFGDTDPKISELPGSPSFLWTADSMSYVIPNASGGANMTAYLSTI